MMHNKLYLIRYQDKDTGEIAEYEESNINNALEIYNSLVCADDVGNLSLLEYDVITKKYYLMEV
jgi:hypothetical protein